MQPKDILTPEMAQSILDSKEVSEIGEEAVSQAFPDWFPFAKDKTQYIYTCAVLVTAVEVLRKIIGDAAAKEFLHGALDTFADPSIFDKDNPQ